MDEQEDEVEGVGCSLGTLDIFQELEQEKMIKLIFLFQTNIFPLQVPGVHYAALSAGDISELVDGSNIAPKSRVTSLSWWKCPTCAQV